MEKSSFFNSVGSPGDRIYDAQSFADYFKSLVTNGVFPNPSSNLQVMSNNNMTVVVKQGPAWINGYNYINESDLTLPIDIADGILDRIDRIVIRFDKVGRAINTIVKKGVNSSTPVAVGLQRDADGYELAIADVYVGKGVANIPQAKITDLRMNTDLCGWVNSLIQADTTSIFNQYQEWYTQKQLAYDTQTTSWINDKRTDYETWFLNQQIDLDAKEVQFNNDWSTWFQSIQNSLSGDIAGNLSTRIDNIPKIYRGQVAPTSPTSSDFWFQQI